MPKSIHLDKDLFSCRPSTYLEAWSRSSSCANSNTHQELVHASNEVKIHLLVYCLSSQRRLDRLRFPRSFSMLSVTSTGESSSEFASLLSEVCVNQARDSIAASLSASCLFFLGLPTNCIPLNSTNALNSFVLRCLVLYFGGECPALISKVWSKLFGLVPSFVNLSLLDNACFLLFLPKTNLPSHWSPDTNSWTERTRYLPSLRISSPGFSSWNDTIIKLSFTFSRRIRIYHQSNILIK